MTPDWLVVGAGFTGCTVAERLAAAGKSVLLIDARERLGGNCADSIDAAGVLVHDYGPHIFHTSDQEVFHYLRRFCEWREYEHRVLAEVRGALVPVPANLDTMSVLYADRAEESERLLTARYGFGTDTTIRRLLDDDELKDLAQGLYQSIYEGYSRKQWGLDPRELDASVLARVPVRISRDDRYFTDTFQGVPRDGYSDVFERMVGASPLITVALGVSFEEVRASHGWSEGIVFTGPVDSYFGCRYGRLPYRALDFRFETLPVERPLQPVATINYPLEHEYTRSTEFRILTGQRSAYTTLCYEYPLDASGSHEPMYPVLTAASREQHARYTADAARERVLFLGRLGEFRYLNMDQAIRSALDAVRMLLG